MSRTRRTALTLAAGYRTTAVAVVLGRAGLRCRKTTVVVWTSGRGMGR